MSVSLSICQTFVHLSYIHLSIFSFLDHNLSKCQWIFTKFFMCIDIVEIWFGIANGQILSIFDRVICLQPVSNFNSMMITLVNINGFFTKLNMCIDIVEIWFGIADGQILSIFDKSYVPTTSPYFHFQEITYVNSNGFSPKSVCALVLWRSALRLLMGKVHQFLTELPACNTSVF